MRVGQLSELKQLSFWSRVLGWLSIIGWIIFVVALVVFHYARPEQSTLLTEIFGIDVRDYWHITLGELFVVLCLLGLLLSSIAFTINLVLFRQHRQHLWLNLMILMLTCVGGLSIYFFGA